MKQIFPALAVTLAVTLAAALPAMAQQTPPLTCTLRTICVETRPCADWGQTLAITEQDDGAWEVIWTDTTLPSDYTLIADIPAPDGAITPLRMRTLLHTNTAMQAIQVISFDDAGNITVTGQQPHVTPRVVNGFGTCAGAAG